MQSGGAERCLTGLLSWGIALALCLPALAGPIRALPLNRAPWSRSAQQDVQGFYLQPAGVCEDYPEDETSLAKIRADFASLKALGAHQLRFAFGWDGIETSPGHYDWGFWDDFVRLAGEAGIELIPYVCYSPEWSNAGGGDFWRTPPRDSAAFARFMQTIVTRYKGQIRTWELWNEPDIEAYWLGTADQFAEMIQKAARAVRQADPQAVIVLGGMSHGRGPFFDRLIQIHRLERYVDVLNLHGYNETWLPGTVEDYPDQIRHFGAILPPAGALPDIWLAEFGYSNWRFAAAKVSQWGVDAIYAYEHTPRYQAISLLKAHLMAREAGNLSLTAWYRLRDLPPATGVIGDDNNKYLGLLDVQGQPKPAWHALRLYNRLYSRPLRSLGHSLRITAGDAKATVISAFADRQGHLLLAAWLRSPRRQQLGDQSGHATDTRQTTLSLTLPASYKSLKAYSLSGAVVPSSARLTGQQLTNLNLRGGELFLAELSP